MNFVTIAREVKQDQLLARLAQHADLWQQGSRETYQGSAHSEAHSIHIRWVQSAESLAAVLNSIESVDQPAAKRLMPEIGEAVMSVLERVGVIGDLGHVLLTRLPPGAEIASHADEGVYADIYDRFHLCLQGDAGNTFECAGEELHPAPGDIFWFNHKREHLVRNTGAIERIHLIVDVMAPEYTRLRGIYYQAERVSDLWEEVSPLLQAHYQEIAHYQDIPLDPDRDAYLALEQAGELRCYTVRDCARLAGYVVFFVRPSLHYRGSLQAHQDVLYLDPNYRRGRVGITLIRLAEKRLRAEGVQVVYHHAKLINEFGPLLKAIGYTLVDEIYGKRVDLERK